MVLVLALIAGGLAALLHVYIFWMEAVAWHRPAVWQRFGVRGQEAADLMRPMAYNQGFYNLFLAVGAALGLVLCGVNAVGSMMFAAGFTLAVFALGCMVAAACVLITTGRRLVGAALTQGVPPLVGVVLLLVALFV